jgi:hypothetical protein
MLTNIYFLHWIIDDFFFVCCWCFCFYNHMIKFSDFFLFFQKHLYSFDIFFSHYKNTLQVSKFYIRWSISLFCGGAFYYFLTTFVTEFPFFFFVFVFSGEISFVLTCILSSVLILDFDWFCILKVFFKKSWFLKIPCLFSCSSELWNWSLYISRPWRQVWKPTSPGLLFHQSLLLVFV